MTDKEALKPDTSTTAVIKLMLEIGDTGAGPHGEKIIAMLGGLSKELAAAKKREYALREVTEAARRLVECDNPACIASREAETPFFTHIADLRLKLATLGIGESDD